MPNKKKLVMRFDPNTIEHLGVKMYSQIPTAIAELIANSYDADAKKVSIHLFEDEKSKKIVVEDNGAGMTFDEINDEFLIIGRNRRAEGKTTSPSGKRTATGKKGLGKLALFGIGDTIEIITKKGGQKVHFRMNWNRLKTSRTDYTPEIVSIEKYSGKSGTTIILSDLKRKSKFDLENLAISLSKLFNFYDSNFKVNVISGDSSFKVTKELRYSSIESEFEFDMVELIGMVTKDYPHKTDLKGCILTTEKPLKPGLRGLTLFANGRLVNAPEFFGRSESSYFYSYATGWIEADFIDNWEQDVISTNRQTLNWNLEETEILRLFLQSVIRSCEIKWREVREQKTKEDISVETNINIGTWFKNLPEDVLSKVEKVVNTVAKRELTRNERKEAIQELNSLIPPYPYYHWRHLHEEIKRVSSNYYKRKDYYGAFLESVKKYINTTRQKSEVGHESTEADLMARAFHHNSGSLNVTANYNRPNGEEFSPATLENIQEGHFLFSKGTVQGGRHPVAHEEVDDLRESGLFSEKDCLDLLSLLSHLHNRLDNAEKK